MTHIDHVVVDCQNFYLHCTGCVNCWKSEHNFRSNFQSKQYYRMLRCLCMYGGIAGSLLSTFVSAFNNRQYSKSNHFQPPSTLTTINSGQIHKLNQIVFELDYMKIVRIRYAAVECTHISYLFLRELHGACVPRFLPSCIFIRKRNVRL